MRRANRASENDEVNTSLPSILNSRLKSPGGERKSDQVRLIIEQSAQIERNKQCIEELQREIEKFDLAKMNQQISKIKQLKQEVSRLEDNKKELIKINENQRKALDLQLSKNTNVTLQSLRIQYEELLQESKSRQESHNLKEKELRSLHEQCFQKEQKLKKLQRQSQTSRLLDKLPDDSKRTRMGKASKASKGRQELKRLQKLKQQMSQQLQRRKGEVEEKERNLKYFQLKYKELKDQINEIRKRAGDTQSGRKIIQIIKKCKI